VSLLSPVGVSVNDGARPSAGFYSFYGGVKMKIEAVKDYYDLELQKDIKKGDVFEVSAARGKALTTTENKMGYPLCKVIEEPKKTTRKKKEE